MWGSCDILFKCLKMKWIEIVYWDVIGVCFVVILSIIYILINMRNL